MSMRIIGDYKSVILYVHVRKQNICKRTKLILLKRYQNNASVK